MTRTEYLRHRLAVAAVLALSLVLAPTAASGQTTVPKAVLVGPATVAQGTMAIVKTEGSDGKNFRWLILPKAAEAWFLPVFVDAGAGKQERAGVLVPGGPGPIYINLIATASDVSDVATLVVNESDPPSPPVPPPPLPAKNPYLPTVDYQPVMAKILVVKMSRDDATRLAAMYATVGKDAEAGKMKTVTDLRAAIISRGIPLGLKGKYADLKVAVEFALTSVFGLPETETDVNREGAVPYFDTLAWAVWETGK